MKKHKTTKTQSKEAPQPVSKPALKERAVAAIFELRMREDFTQQNMADELGVGLRSLTRVESGGKPLTKALAFKLGLLASQHGHDDLASVFRDYLYPGKGLPGYTPPPFVPRPQIDSRQGTNLRNGIAASAGYNQILRENVDRLEGWMKDPEFDRETVNLFLGLLRTTLEHQAKALDELSKIVDQDWKGQ